jgi:hypothetical protein
VSIVVNRVEFEMSVRSSYKWFTHSAALVMLGLSLAAAHASSDQHEPVVEIETSESGTWVNLEAFVPVTWPAGVKIETAGKVSRLEFRVPDDFQSPVIEELGTFRVRASGPSSQRVAPVVLLVGKVDGQDQPIAMNLPAGRNNRDGWVRVVPVPTLPRNVEALGPRLLETADVRGARLSKLYVGVVVIGGRNARRLYLAELRSVAERPS